MSTDLVLYRAFGAMMQTLDETRYVEFEILSANRARYRDLLFDFDRVVGYARDLRLIEYRIEDTYAGSNSRKVIYIYPYGTHPAGTPGIERREADGPSGHWARYFRELPKDLLRHRQISGRRSQD